MNFVRKRLAAASMWKLTIPAVALAVLYATPGAQAKEVKLGGLHSIGAVRSACANAGGTMWNNGGRYGCVNGSKGTSVDCTPGGECTGTVPGRKNPDSLTVRGALTTGLANTGKRNAAPAMRAPGQVVR